MKNLVINAGSSSVKFSVFDDEKSVLTGVCEEIGSDRSMLKYNYNNEKTKKEIEMLTHKEALSKIINLLEKLDLLNSIEFVSHRIVHGGEKFKDTTEISEDIIRELETLTDLAPLHNPSNLEGIKIMRKSLPDVKHFGVFDTAYHSTMPEKSYLYALPHHWYEKHGVRRYGFHGSSHKYVIKEAVKKLGKENPKIISCHLGNGASVCASLGGKSINTSMGRTPLEGLMMGTRSGSFDPAIVQQIMQKEGLSIEEVDKILNKESGILGVSKISSDMRVIEEEMEKGNEGAIRAFNLFCHKVIQYVGSYIAELGGVDAIVFTGGIGEKGFLVREQVAKHLEFLGVEIDSEKNNSNFEGEITTPDSKVKFYIIPTNEELQMTRDSKEMMCLA